ncbi:NAD(P)-binding Rossmann-fold superfamily protein [Actinidia rufa]|uniref:NAD(P)-binding Rossmann-fold superfamily protein n=1 Tax=Actinidia rufa TaxID=165716 RepID=A0A7J0DKV6_9ERIC|nr:NAD(P)-binding Rossmann-fold superfamily protein [Actinidia rufa]
MLVGARTVSGEARRRQASDDEVHSLRSRPHRSSQIGEATGQHTNNNRGPIPKTTSVLGVPLSLVELQSCPASIWYQSKLVEQMDSCNLRINVLDGQTIQPNAGQTTSGLGENSANNNTGGNGENQGEQAADQHPDPTRRQQFRATQGQGAPQSSVFDWTNDLLQRGQYETNDTARDITKKIKMEVLDFEGQVNPTVFADWLASIEEYFDWYDMANDGRVRFAKMKLLGLEKIWWMGVEGDIRRLGQPPISNWQEMKAKLREKNLMSLKLGVKVVEDPSQTLARFKTALRPDIKRELLRQPLYNLEHAFQPSADPKGKNHLVNKGEGKVSKCFRCGEAGHMAYHCPKRNLHIGVEHEDESDQQNHEDDVESFDVEALNTDDLEDDEIDFSLIAVVRHMLAAPKVGKEDWKLERLRLPVQPHPQPYKGAWIDNTYIPVLPMAEFSYNSSVNRSTGRSPFEIAIGLLPRKPIDLVPLPIEARPSDEAEAFSKHICDIHDDVRRKIVISNESYKRHADLRRRFAEFVEGDMVMIRVKPERYPKGVYKKLHSRNVGPFKVVKKISSNAYLLDLPEDMGISNVFNIEDLNRYTGHIGNHVVTDLYASLPPSKHLKEAIEDLVDHQIVSTRHGGYQKFHAFNSPGWSSFKPGKVDGKWQQPIKMYKRRRMDGSNAQALHYNAVLHQGVKQSAWVEICLIRWGWVGCYLKQFMEWTRLNTTCSKDSPQNSCFGDHRRPTNIEKFSVLCYGIRTWRVTRFFNPGVNGLVGDALILKARSRAMNAEKL